VFVLCGGEIYSQFLSLADEMILSRIPGSYDGTAHFPEWDDTEWAETRQEHYDKFDVVHYERVP
jgi:dihydrofolate reductase